MITSVSSWVSKLVEAQAYSESQPCPRCGDPGVASIDLVCPGSKCDAAVQRRPIFGLSWGIVLWAVRFSIMPLSFGIAAGFDPAIYIFGTVVCFAFIYVFFHQHGEVKIYSLGVHTTVSIAVGLIAFASTGSVLLPTALVLGIVLVGLGIMFPALKASSMLAAISEVQALALVVWLPVVAVGVSLFTGEDLLAFFGLAAVLLAFGVMLVAVPDTIPAAYRAPVSHKLKLIYVGAPRNREPPDELTTRNPSEYSIWVRPVIQFVNAAIRTVSAFRRASVSFWNRIIKSVFRFLNAALRIIHRIALRSLEIYRAYAVFLSDLYRSARRTIASFFRLVVWPVTLMTAGLILLSAASNGVVSYVQDDYWFRSPGWAQTIILALEFAGVIVLYLFAISVLVSPWGRVWTALANFLPEQFFFAVLFFWANSMVLFLGSLAAEQVPGIEMLDSPYRYGPASTFATLMLGGTLLYAYLSRENPAPATTPAASSLLEKLPHK